MTKLHFFSRKDGFLCEDKWSLEELQKSAPKNISSSKKEKNSSLIGSRVYINFQALQLIALGMIMFTNTRGPTRGPPTQGGLQIGVLLIFSCLALDGCLTQTSRAILCSHSAFVDSGV